MSLLIPTTFSYFVYSFGQGFFGKWHMGVYTTEFLDANRGGKTAEEFVQQPSRHGIDNYTATESKVGVMLALCLSPMN